MCKYHNTMIEWWYPSQNKKGRNVNSSEALGAPDPGHLDPTIGLPMDYDILVDSILLDALACNQRCPVEGVVYIVSTKPIIWLHRYSLLTHHAYRLT